MLNLKEAVITPEAIFNKIRDVNDMYKEMLKIPEVKVEKRNSEEVNKTDSIVEKNKEGIITVNLVVIELIDDL